MNSNTTTPPGTRHNNYDVLTANAYVPIFSAVNEGGQIVEITVKNTDGTNVVTYQLVSIDTNGTSTTGSATDIAAGGTAHIKATPLFTSSFILSIKSKVGDAHATVEVSPTLLSLGKSVVTEPAFVVDNLDE